MFCPKCGNEIKEGASFCPKCGTKVARNQENFQQNNYKSQNSQQNKNVKKHTIITKQNIGLIVGLAFMFLGGLTLFTGDVLGGRIFDNFLNSNWGSNYVLYKILK